MRNRTKSSIVSASGIIALLALLTAGAQAQQVIATVGDFPLAQEIAIDEAHDRVFFTVDSTLGAAVVDGNTNVLLGTVPAGQSPWGIAFNPTTGRVYVCNQTSGGVTVFDGGTLTVLGTINPYTATTTALVDVRHNRIYVGQESTSLVWVIDGATDAQVATIDTGVLRPSLMALDDVTGKLYVANNTAGPIVVVDTATNSPVGSLPVPLGGHFAIDHVHNRLYFTEVATHHIDVFDLATNAMSFVAVEPDPLPFDPLFGIAYNPATNHIFVARGMSHTVVVLDATTFARVATLQAGNYAVALNAVTNTVYVTERGELTPEIPPGPGRLWVIRDEVQPLQVVIDIKPGDSRNTIKLGSGGTVPVAILGTPTVDVTTVDPLSVTLAAAPVQRKPDGNADASIEDVNGDGKPDLVLHVQRSALQLSSSSTEAMLRGHTFAGRPFEGRDSVHVIP